METEIDSGRSQSVGSREICFAIEGSLDGSPLFKGQWARDRVIDLFSQLRMWDTQHNTGVPIYLLLADRDVEIVADRGIDAVVGSQTWARRAANGSRLQAVEFRGRCGERCAASGAALSC